MSKSFKTSSRTRILLPLFILPGIGLIILLGIDLTLTANIVAGMAFVIAGLLLALWLVFQLTVRIEMDDQSIIRSWMFGSTTVPIRHINILNWGGSKGQRILTIRFEKHWIQLSSLTFSRTQLQEIQDDILAFRGLEGQPLWPPMAPYVDIDKMLEQIGNLSMPSH
ncbi:hypothetical protein CS053_11865 [Rhodanobacter glycinis]|uniref:PH domain-containing protein n=1 Tax=Rhodanobacter glycinis TaxID=582702 RepID=A0A5B9E366_9GAMM|nr:hypothetical protein [Rhodanobacter glycinis]QEE25111.1 hypothetical protein CS053_11865 [Rhodanobacter glycinis]